MHSICYEVSVLINYPLNKGLLIFLERPLGGLLKASGCARLESCACASGLGQGFPPTPPPVLCTQLEIEKANELLKVSLSQLLGYPVIEKSAKNVHYCLILRAYYALNGRMWVHPLSSSAAPPPLTERLRRCGA